MTRREHWEKVYATTPPNKVGWYKTHLETSLNWIKALPLDKDANIIDVGGGCSTLVDDLLRNGYRSITVTDLSQTALTLTKMRLGEKAASISWLEGDVTSMDLPAARYDLWHDRAVFHFLIEPEQRQRYVSNLVRGLKSAGHLIMATFSPEAPPKCSGLPVERYSADKLGAVLGSEFLLKKEKKELHTTPGGVEQMYLYCHFQRTT